MTFVILKTSLAYICLIYERNAPNGGGAKDSPSFLYNTVLRSGYVSTKRNVAKNQISKLKWRLKVCLSNKWIGRKTRWWQALSCRTVWVYYSCWRGIDRQTGTEVMARSKFVVTARCARMRMCVPSPTFGRCPAPIRGVFPLCIWRWRFMNAPMNARLARWSSNDRHTNRLNPSS